MLAADMLIVSEARGGRRVDGTAVIVLEVVHRFVDETRLGAQRDAVRESIAQLEVESQLALVVEIVGCVVIQHKGTFRGKRRVSSTRHRASRITPGLTIHVFDLAEGLKGAGREEQSHPYGLLIQRASVGIRWPHAVIEALVLGKLRGYAQRERVAHRQVESSLDAPGVVIANAGLEVAVRRAEL